MSRLLSTDGIVLLAAGSVVGVSISTHNFVITRRGVAENCIVMVALEQADRLVLLHRYNCDHLSYWCTAGKEARPLSGMFQTQNLCVEATPLEIEFNDRSRLDRIRQPLINLFQAFLDPSTPTSQILREGPLETPMRDVHEAAVAKYFNEGSVSPALPFLDTPPPAATQPVGEAVRDDFELELDRLLNFDCSWEAQWAETYTQNKLKRFAARQGAETYGCSMGAQCTACGPAQISYTCFEGHSVCVSCTESLVEVYCESLEQVLAQNAAGMTQAPPIICPCPGCRQQLSTAFISKVLISGGARADAQVKLSEVESKRSSLISAQAINDLDLDQLLL